MPENNTICPLINSMLVVTRIIASSKTSLYLRFWNHEASLNKCRQHSVYDTSRPTSACPIFTYWLWVTPVNHHDPQKATPCAKTRHTTYSRSWTSVHPFFAQLTLLPIPKSYAIQSFSIGQTYQACLFSAGSSGSTRLSIPNCISISSAVFAQLTADCPFTLQCATER